jgi:hypothetical protein
MIFQNIKYLKEVIELMYMDCSVVKILKSDLRKLKKIRRQLEDIQDRDLRLHEALNEVIKTYLEVKGIEQQKQS